VTRVLQLNQDDRHRDRESPRWVRRLGTALIVLGCMAKASAAPAPSARSEGDFQPSFDVNQRLGANVLASGTVNTDFAQTEVDTRRTNFTRFPLFFPEKRTFFLEGADILGFGLGLE
jgi:hypothetical protein